MTPRRVRPTKTSETDGLFSDNTNLDGTDSHRSFARLEPFFIASSMSRLLRRGLPRQSPAQPEPPARGNRFANVDLLRAIAALLVLWRHVADAFVNLPSIAAHGTVLAETATYLSVGRLGVVTFFAISGFVIVPTLQRASKHQIADFFVKRFFRLFPAFWLSVITAALVLGIPAGDSVPILLANLSMVPLEFDSPEMIGTYWTLEVKLIFYCLIGLLAWKRWLHGTWTLVIMASVATTFWFAFDKNQWTHDHIIDRNDVWYRLGLYLSIMFWGAACRRVVDIFPDGRWPLDDRRLVPFFVITFAVFLRPLLGVFHPTFPEDADWRGTILGLFLFVGFIRLPNRWAVPLQWLGTISYSLYLFHPLVFYPFHTFVTAHPEFADAHLSVYLMISATLSIAAAVIIYGLVEAPMNRFARRLVRSPDQT